MKRRKSWQLPLAMLLLAGSVFSACSDDIADSDHYKAPSWLKGNAYEVLQKEGNYNTFLKGIDLTGYTGIVSGKSILTVMAPNDEAFCKFLSSKGYSSIEEMYAAKPEYVKKCIGYHLMYYAFDWSKLVNFRPTEGDAASAEEKLVNAGYYYKHRTHSQDPIEEVRVKMTSNATSDTLLQIYHYERYLPVLSNRLFETKGIDAAYNYNYFFPQSEWKNGGADGTFNVANAKVDDNENVITDNGYLYHIDQVIEPMNTIYDELKSNAKYSQFLSLYDAYSDYSTPADDETNTSLGYIANIHSHGDLPNIAWEWPVRPNTSSELATSMASLEKDGYNLFVPTNNAMQKFFTNYWTADGGYTSLNTLDPLISQYFIKQSFTADNFLAFPEEIKKGTVLTRFGTPINIDPEQVTDRKMCCNGLLYGLDNMEAPAIFSSVAGPAFKDTSYISYLYALDGSDFMLSLASQNTKYVTLMPTNAQFQKADPAMRLYSTTSGKQLQAFSSETGTFVELGSSSMLTIVNMHTASGIDALPATGSKVIETNIAYRYWFVKDGKITTNYRFNEQLEPTYTGTPYVPFHEIKNNGGKWSNGSSYSYDAESLFLPNGTETLSHKLAVCNDKNYKYYLFVQLLQKAGLISSGQLSSDLLPPGTTRFFLFIPTNEAIKANLNSIPGCDKLSVAANGAISGTLSAANKTKLSDYLRSYFVANQTYMIRFTAYPYIGSGCTGSFNTCGSSKLSVADTGSSIEVKFAGSADAVSVDPEYSYLPFAFSDGCFHFINDILK